MRKATCARSRAWSQTAIKDQGRRPCVKMTAPASIRNQSAPQQITPHPTHSMSLSLKVVRSKGDHRMRTLFKASTLLFAASLFVAAASAQTPDKSAAPKPPDSQSKVLLDSWNDIGRKLIAMAEEMPEDKYDFKPTPAQRSFAEQLLHAAGANYFFINPAKGLEAPKGDPKRAEFKSKSELVDYVKKSFADGAALIQSKGDSGLGDLMVDPF